MNLLYLHFLLFWYSKLTIYLPITQHETNVCEENATYFTVCTAGYIVNVIFNA